MKRLGYRIYLISLLFSFASLVFFTGFYIYKIVTSTNHPFYLSCYIAFLALTIITAIIEVIFIRRKDDDRETKREKKLKRKKAKLVIKLIKYIVKLATIVLAIIELVTIEATVGKVIALLFAIHLFVLEVFFTIMYLRLEHKVKKIKDSFTSLGHKNLEP